MRSTQSIKPFIAVCTSITAVTFLTGSDETHIAWLTHERDVVRQQLYNSLLAEIKLMMTDFALSKVFLYI